MGHLRTILGVIDDLRDRGKSQGDTLSCDSQSDAFSLSC
jgi:hypothetical protein